MNKNRPIRIGQINFANVWPLFHKFPHEAFKGELDFISQVPTSLNKAMALGEIDMGPISSFAYGENFEAYMLFPHMSVSAYGAVQSILLFHRQPIATLGQGTIALPTTSATSVNLLKILLAKFNGIRPRYSYEEPVLQQMMEHADAALLIGDDAIRAQWADPPYKVTDLGEMWRRATGQWMSFAVWAVRKQIIQERPELVARIYQAFLHSKQESLQNITSMVKDAQRQIGGTEAYWERYFTQLQYDFGPLQQAGLQMYYDYAWELGLLKHQVPLQIWDNKSAIQVKE